MDWTYFTGSPGNWICSLQACRFRRSLCPACFEEARARACSCSGTSQGVQTHFSKIFHIDLISVVFAGLPYPTKWSSSISESLWHHGPEAKCNWSFMCLVFSVYFECNQTCPQRSLLQSSLLLKASNTAEDGLHLECLHLHRRETLASWCLSWLSWLTNQLQVHVDWPIFQWDLGEWPRGCLRA